MRHRFLQEGLHDDPARAWRLLEVAQQRLDSIAGILLTTSSVEDLLKDPDARAIRVAAFGNAAYSRDHFIKGLVEYGEIMNREEVADRWRQHLLYTLDWTGNAGRLFQRFLDLGENVDEDAAADLLDITLTLPVHLIVHSVDIRGVLGFFAGGSTTRTPAFRRTRSNRGGPPASARRRRPLARRRMDPGESLEWIKAGIPYSFAAATFAWRSIDIEASARWYAAGIDGRVAGRWMAREVMEPNHLAARLESGLVRSRRTGPSVQGRQVGTNAPPPCRNPSTSSEVGCGIVGAGVSRVSRPA